MLTNRYMHVLDIIITSDACDHYISSSRIITEHMLVYMISGKTVIERYIVLAKRI